MQKKISELLDTDMMEICKKYFNKDFNDTCKNCPLQVNVIYCVKGLVEEQTKLGTKLFEVNQLLDECYDMEIEVEE